MTQKGRSMLGVTQIQPLLVLAEARTPLTTAELSARMTAITGRSPYQAGALTTMLARLEGDGLVIAEMGYTLVAGRNPLLYQLTPAGLARLTDTIGQFRKLVKVADGVLELAHAV